ncbi:unnamed protein product [Caenorhabditis nigoni]
MEVMSVSIKVEEYRRNLLEPLKSEPITVVGEVAKNINQIVLYEDKQQSTNEKMKIPETPKDERKPKVINNPEHVKEYTIVVVTKEIPNAEHLLALKCSVIVIGPKNSAQTMATAMQFAVDDNLINGIYDRQLLL